jgi:hypothetical protein
MNLERILIEVGGEPVGIAVYEGRACRFYASSRTAAKLDKLLFPSPQAVEEACRKLGARTVLRTEGLSRRPLRDSQGTQAPADEIPTPQGGLPYDFPFMHF